MRVLDGTAPVSLPYTRVRQFIAVYSVVLTRGRVGSILKMGDKMNDRRNTVPGERVDGLLAVR